MVYRHNCAILFHILQKVICHAYTNSLKFRPTQTKMSYYGTKDHTLFLNNVMLISNYYLTIELIITITFNTFQ